MAPVERWWVIFDLKPHASIKPRVVGSPARPTVPQGFVAEGPFPTRAAAQKAAAPTPPGGGLGITGNPSLSPLSDLGKIGHWIGDAVLHLFDLPMWRSIGWLLLGLLLAVGGIYLWFRTSDTYKGLESAALGTVKAL